MKPWQFDLAVVVALGLLVFFAVAPSFGLEVNPHPLVASAWGALVGLVLSNRDRFTRKGKDDEGDEGDDDR